MMCGVRDGLSPEFVRFRTQLRIVLWWLDLVEEVTSMDMFQ
jgi:hypothetical protein